MLIFFKVLWITILSSAIGLTLFWLLLFFTWGRIISVETSFFLSIAIAIFIFFTRLVKLFKQENNTKIIISILIIIITLALAYAYTQKNNSTLYKYIQYPCKGTTFLTDYNLTVVSYAGTSMKGFDLISKYKLEDEYYFNISKATKTLIKLYSSKSSWKFIGLYSYGRYHLKYLLLENLNDQTKAWLYIDNFNYQECKIDFYYDENRSKPFNIYYPNNDAIQQKVNIKNKTRPGNKI